MMTYRNVRSGIGLIRRRRGLLESSDNGVGATGVRTPRCAPCWFGLSMLVLLFSWHTLAIASGVPDAELQQLGFAQSWQAALPLAGGDQVVAGYRVDDDLYVVSGGGRFFSVQATAGLLRWADDVAESNYAIYPPSHGKLGNHDVVVIPTTAATVYYDRYKGTRLWRVQPRYAVGSGTASIGDVLLQGSTNGKLYATIIDVTGAGRSRLLWSVFGNGAITASPVVVNGESVLFASQGGAAFLCDVADKTHRWSLRTGGAITADPIVHGRAAYIASEDRSLYCVDLGTGRLLWRKRFPSPLRHSPVVRAERAYQYCDQSGLVALDAVSGRQDWALPDGQRFAAQTPAGDVVQTNHGTLSIIDRTSGEVRGSLSMGSAFGVVTNTLDDAVYLLDRNGAVQCIRSAKVPYIRRRQVAAARAQLHRPPPQPGVPVLPESLVPANHSTAPDTDPLRSLRDTNPPR